MLPLKLCRHVKMHWLHYLYHQLWSHGETVNDSLNQISHGSLDGTILLE